MKPINSANEGHVNIFATSLLEAFMSKKPVDHKITKEEATAIINNAVLLANTAIDMGASNE